MHHNVQGTDSSSDTVRGHRQHIEYNADYNHPPHLGCRLKFKAEAQDCGQDDDKSSQAEKHPQKTDGNDAGPFNECQANQYWEQDYFHYKPDQP